MDLRASIARSPSTGNVRQGGVEFTDRIRKA